ncbi:putative disease resistance protein RGA1 [Papaver somniferum]|uniref:putative disease resistance protein RGA1 n=1 Tax=Papaver somniferum TaxID=3469 RepID=UPI000E6F5926|nr:putative disease resistance protein RGA1 [Papaver somniferum]
MAAIQSLVSGTTGILTELVSVTSSILGSVASIQFGASRDELLKLQHTLKEIALVTEDAETKQATEMAVGVWLGRLKDVAYDADDVLDEFLYEFMREPKDKDSVAFSLTITQKVKDINCKLNDISRDEVFFQLQPSTVRIPADQSCLKRYQLASSLVDDGSEIIGRENDKSEIIKMLTIDTVSPSSSSESSLLSENYIHKEKISVLSLVGVGGIGKTTLAQLVYKDELIKIHFEKFVWVCVKDFHVSKILQKILEFTVPFTFDDDSIVHQSPRNDIFDVSNFKNLVHLVEQELRGKKFLLVLDDLWNESVTEWNELRSILNVGAHGSKILVTTRSRVVEYNVRGLFPPYNVKHLSDDECLSIIRMKAFSPGGALQLPIMSEIGKEISKKCAGLPLAAIFFGNLMYLHNTETYWSKVRDDVGLNTSDNPNDIIPILKLSYDILPSHLKQCFSYTSIFPKGWEIEKDKLVQLWIAEGFLQPFIAGSQQSMEDIGNDYFQSLLRRSFFEVVKRDKLGEILLFKIHDLLVDLARSVLGRDELMILDASEMKSTCFQKDIENASEVRRLHLIFDEYTSETFFRDTRKLRTVIACGSTNMELGHLVGNKCLRVISLQNFYHKRKRIPYRVQSSLKFMHLRYLDLSGFHFEYTINQVSIDELYNLQTLVLSYCFGVQIILGGIIFLKKLRHLNLSYSDVEFLPGSITSLARLQTLNLSHCIRFEELPDDIGSLEHLKSLILSSTGITELPDSLTLIRNLRRLEIDGCGKLKSLPRRLGELTQLRCLDLTLTEVIGLPESCAQNLSNLEIVNLGTKCELPDEIKNWSKLKSFIHFGRLGVYNTLPRGIESLTCLQELRPYMVGEEDVEIEKLANLKSLEVLYITNLKRVIRGGKKGSERAKLKEKSRIRELHLDFGIGMSENEDEERTPKMVLEGLEPHSNLKELSIKYFEGLEFPKWMICLPNLVKLEFSNCGNCVYLPSLGLLPCLRILHVYEVSSLKCLGEEFYGKSAPSFFPSLVVLKISGARMLEEWEFPPPSLHSSFPSLRHLSIHLCSNLTTAPNSFHSLKELELWNINSKAVNSIFSSEGGGGLTSLTDIYLNSIEDLEYFPLGVLRNNSRLQSLKIKSCMNLKGFHDDLSPAAFRTVTSSLYSFSLLNCPALSSLPDLRLWTSLRKLDIRGSEKLMESVPEPCDLASLVFIETLNLSRLFYENDAVDQEIISVAPEDGYMPLLGRNLQVMRMRNLDNATDGWEFAVYVYLMYEYRLRHLYLSWDPVFSDSEEVGYYRSDNHAEVLEGLKPHTNLRKLSISGYEGSKLPEWIMDSSCNCLPNLVELYFLECNTCEQLIGLGMLPCLRVLQIKGMNSVKRLGKEFYCQKEENSGTTTASSSEIRLFPSLMELSLMNMSSLEEWIAPPHQYNSFPSLEKFVVSDCARLKSIPLASCSSLKSLELRNTNDEAVNSILASQGREGQLASLASVSIQDSPQFIYFPVVLLQKDSHIQSLEIAHCSKFKGLRILDDDYFQAKQSPDTGCNTSISYLLLKLFDCLNIQSPDTRFSNSISSLCSLKLRDCPALTSLPDLRKWTCLTELWIEDCDKLRKSFPYDLESLHNLKTLYVDCFIDLSREEEVDLPTTTSN